MDLLTVYATMNISTISLPCMFFYEHRRDRLILTKWRSIKGDYNINMIKRFLNKIYQSSISHRQASTNKLCPLITLDSHTSSLFFMLPELDVPNHVF